MWIYEKRLQYPVNITKTDARIAKIIATQYGGPDGEIGASMRYLSQRFTAPNRVCMAVLTDVATEELGHLEMVSTIVHQLTANLTVEEIENQGFADYYVDHAVGIWPQSAGGIPFNSCEFQSKGDPITDLSEDCHGTIIVNLSDYLAVCAGLTSYINIFVALCKCQLAVHTRIQCRLGLGNGLLLCLFLSLYHCLSRSFRLSLCLLCCLFLRLTLCCLSIYRLYCCLSLQLCLLIPLSSESCQ